MQILAELSGPEWAGILLLVAQERPVNLLLAVAVVDILALNAAVGIELGHDEMAIRTVVVHTSLLLNTRFGEANI